MYMNKNFLSTFKRVLAAAVVLLAAFLLIGCPEDTPPPAAPTPPADPANLTIAFGDTQTILTWDTVVDAVEYRIYRADTADGTLTRIAEDVKITDTSYTDTGLTNGTTYRYVVRAVSSAGAESGDSPEASTTPTPPPAAPTGLTATASDFQVTLSWTAVTDITEYSVYRAESANGTFARIAGSVTNATTYTDADTSFAINTAYHYVVRAVIRVNGSIGESANSDVVEATPLPLPAAPIGFTATAGNMQITLSWTAVTGVTEYRIYRAATADGTLVRINTGSVIMPTTTTYVDTGLTNGTTYRYVIRSVDSIGESPDSDEASAAPLAPPAVPANLTASAGNTQVTLSWTAADRAAEYHIFRASTPTGALTRIAASSTITATSFVNTGLTNGTAYRYAVRAVNTSGESGNSTVATATPRDDHGNSRTTATALTSGTAARGTLSCNTNPQDQDYFSIQITIAASGTPMELAIVTSSADGALTLMNSGGTTLHTDTFRNMHPPQTITTTGIYYFRISCTQPGAHTYTLTVTATEVADTHGNTRATATPVTSGTAVDGNLYAGDTDYFSIAVTGATAASPVTITATTTGVLDTVGKIYNSTGTKLAENDDIGTITGTTQYEDNFRVTYDATANGTYYVEVTGLLTPGNNAHIGDYSITVTTSQ